MKIYFLIVLIIFGFAQSQKNCGETKNNRNESAGNKIMAEKTVEKTNFDNLPDGVKLTDKVRKDVTGEKGEVVSIETTTVEKELKNLGAKYDGGKLVDKNGKEIKFYKPPVRGISQGFEEDERQRELDEKELKELKEKYTVVILYVNPREVS